MEKIYRVNDLSDIAELFERNAAYAMERVVTGPRDMTKEKKTVLKAEAEIWRQAARIVRQTTLNP